MMHDKKQKLPWLLFMISLIINLMLIYFLFDNAITTSYAGMDSQRYFRQKTDAIDFLNLALQDNASFNFTKAKINFLEDRERLYKLNASGEIVLGQLCFQKVEKNYKASFCDE